LHRTLRCGVHAFDLSTTLWSTSLIIIIIISSISSIETCYGYLYKKKTSTFPSIYSFYVQILSSFIGYIVSHIIRSSDLFQYLIIKAYLFPNPILLRNRKSITVFSEVCCWTHWTKSVQSASWYHMSLRAILTLPCPLPVKACHIVLPLCFPTTLYSLSVFPVPSTSSSHHIPFHFFTITI
jgi:hypothetical protein